jgi:NADH:ubiquinone oxidoreductase subunit B-like Fe-S oxidoreductase
VNAFVPGCPPRPEAIIYGVVALLNSLKPPTAKGAETAA